MSDERIDPVYAYIDDIIGPLQEKLDRISMILVRTRINTLIFAVESMVDREYFHDNENFDPDWQRLQQILSQTTSFFKGLLSANELPEDAYRKWHSELRSKLNSSFTRVNWNTMLPEEDDNLFYV